VSNGIYFDGRSARRHDVRVVLVGETLEIRGATGGPLARWPVAELTAVAEGGEGRLRIQRRDGDEARLILDDAGLADRLANLAPDLRPGPRRRRTVGFHFILVVLLVAVFGTAVYYGVPALSRPLARIVPLSWEEKLGRIAMRSILGEAKPCHSPQGDRALDALANRLTAVMTLPYPVDIAIVDMARENAFAAPGGHVVVGAKLIAAMESPDELAGVLAHELGHVEARHPIAGAIRILGLSLLFDMMVGGETGIADNIAKGAGLLLALSYSRDDERAADRTAVETLRRVGIRADGLRQFFERLAKTHGAGAGILAWINTHPSFSERIDKSTVAPNRNLPPALPPAAWTALKTICDGN